MPLLKTEIELSFVKERWNHVHREHGVPLYYYAWSEWLPAESDSRTTQFSTQFRRGGLC